MMWHAAAPVVHQALLGNVQPAHVRYGRLLSWQHPLVAPGILNAVAQGAGILAPMLPQNLQPLAAAIHGILANPEAQGFLLGLNQPITHYGIGLSDDQIFDTASGVVFPAAFVQAQVVPQVFTPLETINRLQHILYCFQEWDYGLLGWNCEHIARLAACGNAECQQIALIPGAVPVNLIANGTLQAFLANPPAPPPILPVFNFNAY